MFGFGKRARLRREIETLRLEKEAHDLRAAVQNSGTTATYPLSDPLAFEKLFGPQTNNVSADKALTHSAVYGCVRLIAGCISMLPFALFDEHDDGHRVRDRKSPLARMLDRRPNSRLSASMFWRSSVADMLLNGNGIAWIERKSFRAAEPYELHQVPWARTGVRLDSVAGRPLQVYTMTLDDGRMIVAPQDDVLHIPGSPIWQIFRAMSPLTAYAMSVGIGISADAFAKAYFDNSSSPDGYITFPNGVAKDTPDEIRKHWMAKHGSDNRFAGPAVFTNGGEFKELRINAADAQLLDTRRFSVEDIATRIFGVPAHLAGLTDKATSFGKGLEEQTQAFVDFTLGPHLCAIEDEVNEKLVPDGKVAEFDREGFVRGDMKTRMEAFQIALGGNNGPGVMTANEVRQKLNMGPSTDPSADKLVTWERKAPQIGQNGGASAEESAKPEPPPPEPTQQSSSRPSRKSRK
ncbi:HK97 family phage portal protein [Methylosinus sp. sav-2]|uniref:phage portal protein n=1 Tax=Methylosinus sp. sav-2 TaxID=2485168 RepID=UPI00047B857B|nr:phage portal protein [Methylosinus sp. sav-2]TDX65160.1 HK97 family phage portal protein [Methylosinus sp. sav-2]